MTQACVERELAGVAIRDYRCGRSVQSKLSEILVEVFVLAGPNKGGVAESTAPFSVSAPNDLLFNLRQTI